MKRKHEQSIIDSFSNYFLKAGEIRGRQTNRFSLDGQDSTLGADYIFTSNTKFALVEFKYEESDIVAEGKKPLRKTLCLRLDQDLPRKNQSLQCHYIAWSKKETSRHILFNKYYLEVCNRELFSNSSLRNSRKDTASRIRAEELVDEFLGGDIGSNFETFNRYTNWLISIGDKEGSGVEVMLDNPDSNSLEILEFASLELVNDWLNDNRPAPVSRPSNSPSPF